MFFVTYHKYVFTVQDNGYSLYLGRDKHIILIWDILIMLVTKQGIQLLILVSILE
jgi:hypothetical protein